MRSRRPSALLLATIVAVSTLGLAGCGSDPVTRDEFIAQMRNITSGPDQATPELSGCIYDKIADDRDLLESASSGADLPKRDEERLASITADCWAQVEDDSSGGGKKDDGKNDGKDDGDSTTTTSKDR